jgi:hypothetical protein
MRCIHVPDMARMFEIENRRKFGTRRELKLWLHGVRPVMTGMGSVGGKADVDEAAVTVKVPVVVVYEESYVWGLRSTLLAYRPCAD